MDFAVKVSSQSGCRCQKKPRDSFSLRPLLPDKGEPRKKYLKLAGNRVIRLTKTAVEKQWMRESRKLHLGVEEESTKHAVMYIIREIGNKAYNVKPVLDKYGLRLYLLGWMVLLEEIGNLRNRFILLEVISWLRSRDTGPRVYNRLITVLGKQGEIGLASWMFAQIAADGNPHDTNSFNAIIMAHLRCNQVEKALNSALWYFEHMKCSAEAQPDLTTFTMLMKACALAGNVTKAEALFWEMLAREILPDTTTFNAIIGGYSKSGCFREMEMKLREMNAHEQLPNEATFNILIEAYGRGRDFGKMERVFQSLRKAKIKLSVATFNLMLYSYGIAGHILEMEQTLVRMDMAGLVPDTGTYNALISSYGKTGHIHAMEKCVTRMQLAQVPLSVYTLDALLQVYVDNGKIVEAEALLLDTVTTNVVTPAASSYVILFNTYDEEHRVDRIRGLFEVMKSRGVELEEGFVSRLIESYTARESEACAGLTSDPNAYIPDSR